MKQNIEKKHRIIFYPDGRSIEIYENESFLKAANELGIPIQSDCGGCGICGKCRVRVIKGKYHTETTSLLTAEEEAQGYVLACISFPRSDLIIEVAPYDISKEVKISNMVLTSLINSELPYSGYPLTEKIYIKCQPPSDVDNMSDLQRLYLTLKEKTDIDNFTLSPCLMQRLSHLLREANWEVTVTFSRCQNPAVILDIEKDNTTKNNYGIVIDIGTTTVEGIIVNIFDNSIKKLVSYSNPQIKYGNDIISRLKFIASNKKGLLILNDIIKDMINEIIMELILQSNIPKEEVYSIVISGNTFMMHFFMGFDTEPLRKNPHVATTLSYPIFQGQQLGLYINPEAQVYITPGVGSYVGGDLIASLIATGLPKENFLLVDIGTNGEVAVALQDNFLCAATSAGPAFEGGGTRFGVRAIPGAINKFYYDKGDKKFKWDTIDNLPPLGICGTGLIDLISTLFIEGIIDKRGHFLNTQNDNKKEFVICKKADSDKNISINEEEIDYIIKSKGALYTGCQYLLEMMGKSEEEIDSFYISGALGGLINIENGITLGLFPEIALEKYHYIGNGALRGGWMLLLSSQARERADDIAIKAAYIDLSQEFQYMNQYTSSLFLPHTQVSRFPKVIDKINKTSIE